MSELQRLKARMAEKFAGGLRNFHVSWGDAAADMTQEERARELNRVLDLIDASEFEVIESFDD